MFCSLVEVWPGNGGDELGRHRNVQNNADGMILWRQATSGEEDVWADPADPCYRNYGYSCLAEGPGATLLLVFKYAESNTDTGTTISTTPTSDFTSIHMEIATHWNWL
jgi:hypothetical protein